MTAGIEAEQLRKSFGSVLALDGLTLRVPAGSVLGLLGPNGAGKSTLMKICTTLLRPDSGWAKVAGFDVVRQPDQVRAAIGLAGQSTSIDSELTGRENLDMLARLYGLSGKAVSLRVDEMLDRFDLGAVADRRAGTYSGGTRRRLDLASALVGEPRVVFLDEPTVGLDPKSRLELWDLLAKISVLGVTVLLATQYLEEADYLTNHLVVIDRGRMLVADTIDRLKEDYGESRLDVVVRRADDVAVAQQVLARIGDGPVTADERLRRLAVGLRAGASAIGTAVAALADAGVEIDDVSLRRPTLDEVFFAITSAADASAADAGAEH